MPGDIILFLFDLNVRTLIAVLFWGNLVLALLIFIYWSVHKGSIDLRLSKYYTLAKLAQSFACFLLFFRGYFPDVWSVNLGNTLLLIGFYLEAVAMLMIIHVSSRKIYIVELFLVIISVILFNTLEFIYPDPALRVVAASLGVFLIIIQPNLLLIFSKNSSRFKRIIGLFYFIFALLLLPRIMYASVYPIDIHSDFSVQVLTFLALVLLMIFSGSSYLLLMKENADKMINLMASLDVMTGLSNRHSFFINAGQVFELGKESKTPVAVLFCDIDDFKKTNDTYGHLFGDYVLIALAGVLKQSLRQKDLSCRYGGEEFVVLLANADHEDTKKVCDRIMAKIAELHFSEHPDFRFTVSIGVVNKIPSEGDSLTQFIDLADQALYIAKRSGKNKTEFYQN